MGESVYQVARTFPVLKYINGYIICECRNVGKIDQISHVIVGAKVVYLLAKKRDP